MWTIALESVFMFVSSMVVFVHIALGGVVGLDIRRSIVLKDLLFGALLSILITIYTTTKFFFLSSVERKNWNDSHLIHAIINLILLENLLMNRSAMAYWRQVSSRLLNRWPIPRSSKVADFPGKEKTEPRQSLSHVITTPDTHQTLLDGQKEENMKVTSKISLTNMGDCNISVSESRRTNKSDLILDNSILEIFHKDGFTQPYGGGAIPQNKSSGLPKIIVVQPK